MMESPQPPQSDETEFGDEREEQNIDGSLDVYEPEPEMPVSDTTHDQAVVLIAALIGLGALVLILGLNLLDRAGILGEACGPNHLRNAQCYQPGHDLPQNQYSPAPVIPGLGLTITIT